MLFFASGLVYCLRVAGGDRTHRDARARAALSWFSFAQFSLDPSNERLWCAEQPITLKPKAFAVLRYLLENSQRLVTKVELLDSVWGGASVRDSVLKAQLRDIRLALGDDAMAPRFIETAHRRGYRFIAAVSKVKPTVPDAAEQAHEGRFVGRESELSCLNRAFETAESARRQVVFVTGPPGIGKTSLINAFADQLQRRAAALVARGQCVNQYGAGEAYLPLLEALGRIGRGPDRSALVSVLRRHAPSWLSQLPELLEGNEGPEQPTVGSSAAPERMLREMAEALEVFALQRPLVLLLEDVHWADPSTLTWIAYVARRTDPTRLLVLATYRPLEVEMSEHPLAGVKRELEIQQRCRELAVPFFSRADADAYLAQRFAGHRFPSELSALLSIRTAGNPLFLIHLLDSWVDQRLIRREAQRWTVGVELGELSSFTPASIVSLIANETERLPASARSLLEAASVAGFEFAAASLAAALDQELTRVEDVCLSWARRGQFIRLAGKAQWPDGTVTTRYEFIHSIYQHTIYERIGPARQAQLHQRIGERQEAAFGERANEVAVELVLHFGRGGDHKRALRYMSVAGEQALQRSAYREAIEHFRRALELLPELCDEEERLRTELTLQVAIGAALGMTLGHGAPEVEQRYGRARELCNALGEAPRLTQTMPGILVFYLVRGKYRTVCDLAQASLLLAEAPEHSRLDFATGARSALESDVLLGTALTFMGDLREARVRLERAVQHDRVVERSSRLQTLDATALGRSLLGVTLWLLGYPDRALQVERETLALGERSRDPSTIALATTTLTLVLQLSRDPRAIDLAVTGAEYCSKHGFPYYFTELCLLGHASAAEGEQAWSQHVGPIRAAWEGLRAIGADLGDTRARFLVALAYARTGSEEEAFRMLFEALERVEASDEHWWEPELHRLLGELVLQSGSVPPEFVARHHLPSSAPLCAEACLVRAVEMAKGMGAKSLELRAALRLSRWWRGRGKAREAHDMLRETYAWFTEGFGTLDLIEANQLLLELAAELDTL